MDAASQNARANQALYQSEGVYDTPQINTGRQKVWDDESGMFVWK